MSKTYFIKCEDCLEVSEIYPKFRILSVRCIECGSCDFKTCDLNGEEE